MDYIEILEGLRQESDLIGHAIEILERMHVGAPRPRGRPPAWLTVRKKEILGVAQTGRLDPSAPTAMPVRTGKRGRPRKTPPGV